ncbi:MAG: CoA-binding protein [Cyanobacteria bacterium P01_H01_bin.21]
MTIRNLEYLFQPKSVAVIGASNHPRKIGDVVMRNLLHGNFSGPVMPVNPKYSAVAGVLCYSDVASLALAPNLAIICTPPATIPKIVAQLGCLGTKAAVVLTAGLTTQKDTQGRSLQHLTLDAANSFDLRILGPNCLGVMGPSIGLNASFSHTNALAGKVAFVSQSGALCTAVVETLARLRSPKGNRLMILSNGGGPGVMATDSLIEGGGTLATLSEETLQQLNEILPPTWSHSNPVDLIGDADHQRYAQALNILLQEPNMDALLVMHVPTAIAPSNETAQAVAEVLDTKTQPRITDGDSSLYSLRFHTRDNHGKAGYSAGSSRRAHPT